MKKEDWNKGLGEIDPELVDEFIEQKAKYARKGSFGLWIRISAIAACVCVVIATAIIVPIALRNGKDKLLEIPDDTTGKSDSEVENNWEQWNDILWGTGAQSTSDTDKDSDASTESGSDSAAESVGNTDKYKETLDTLPSEDTDVPKQPGENQNTAAALDKVNNGVLKDASADEMKIPENIKNLGTSDATEENNADNITATAVTYELDGDVVNWATENDFVYIITQGNNRLVVINSTTMQPVYNVPLAGVPAEMNIVGDNIYISLPNLCRIDVFSKADCTKESSMYFDHEVSSFCIDGDYVYYSEHDQWCKVYKKNLVTGTVWQVRLENTALFYEPKVYLNKEDRILYVGECGSSGSALYYFDADTLEFKSSFKKGDYGIWNHTREIYHIGDDIFWGNYRLSDTNAKELIGQYGTASYGSIVFASNEVVSTYEGLFLTDTYECIINYYEAGFDFDCMIVSNDYNVFFRQSNPYGNIIIGVNLELQR